MSHFGKLLFICMVAHNFLAGVSFAVSPGFWGFAVITVDLLLREKVSPCDPTCLARRCEGQGKSCKNPGTICSPQEEGGLNVGGSGPCLVICCVGFFKEVSEGDRTVVFAGNGRWWLTSLHVSASGFSMVTKSSTTSRTDEGCF